MGEPKPLASLSGLLLARKGAARPAMRRPTTLENDGNAAVNQDDLGWNDMGYDVDPDPTTPMDHEHHQARNPLANAVPEAKPEVRQQQEMIARRLQEQAEVGFDSLPGDTAAAETENAEERSADQILSRKPSETASHAELAPSVTPVVSMPSAAPSITPAAANVAAKPAVKSRKRAAPGSKGKAAFTLRLDKDRHLKLRLACAVSNRSAQMLVTDALDAFLENMPEIGQLAARVPSK
ncbi:hypothetical protein ACFOWX_05810 [Sphingorhabdus arenilitoris]|uniref:Stability/partitioning determinant n=1 Tax=Sphingorhabdus arenilitoris TaxID=1490041 RepID=A0ABV8REW8_9SPHN